MKLDMDGNMRQIIPEELQSCVPNPVIPADEPANTGGDEESS